MNAPAVKGRHILKSKIVYWIVYVNEYGLIKLRDTHADRMKLNARYDLVTKGLLKYHDLKSDNASYILCYDFFCKD